MPSPTEVAALQALLKKLSGTATAAVSTMWNNASDWQQIKDSYADTIDPYVGAAGTITAEWYDGLDPESDFATEAAPLPDAGVFDASVGWSFSQSDALAALVGATERHVFNASRDTVVYNAQREDVRVARYASETACDWCQMLAGRGAVYHSEETASASHDNCHCMAVPERPGDSDWTPPDYSSDE